MTAPSEADAKFLDQRRRLNRHWRVAGWFLLAAITAVLGFLFVTNPILVSPWEVAARLRTGTLPLSTLQTMALMLPVTFLGCFVLLVAVVVFQFAAAANERRLIAIVDVLRDAAADD